MEKKVCASLEKLKKEFALSTKDVCRIVKSFHIEMARGLKGHKSSLKMIPTFVDIPTGRERGEFIALDLGGTNFRVIELKLLGNGRTSFPRSHKFVIKKSCMTGHADELFDFIADCLKSFMKAERISTEREIKLGFTFSFPVEQLGVASGTLLKWTKGFRTRGVVGKNVVELLDQALVRRGIGNVKVAALANDTVGTLIALGYGDRFCDVGVILGTGTNACYREKCSSIKKWKGSSGSGHMIINSEWGNFNLLHPTVYDKALDKGSINPGFQILEKMVSGMYLGEIARLVLCDLIRKGHILDGKCSKRISNGYIFNTEYMSAIEADHTRDLAKVKKILDCLGIKYSTPDDRRAIREVCAIISLRAARISAAAIAGILTKMDPKLSRRHTVAIDGSVYEKHPGFSKNVNICLKELFGGRTSKIRLLLAKDGSGKGAAIIAAVA